MRPQDTQMASGRNVGGDRRAALVEKANLAYFGMGLSTHDERLAAVIDLIRAEVLEEAARVADDEGGYNEDTGSAPSDFANAGRNDAAQTIAAAIRALK